jgi:hypothetical protein
MNHYDIIGDIHGHADTLRALLAKLGYTERAGAFRHPERTVVFVGDFIDRGPKIRETLQIVRAMVNGGSALAVLGNHEWNALRYHTLGADGQPLRSHRAKHTFQHQATLEQVAEPYPGEWREWLAWFKSLPLFLDLGGLRVVHAAWCARSIAEVGTQRFADDAFLHATSRPHQPGYEAVKTILAGPELDLPDGATFLDKNGHEHRDIRVRWFGDGTDEGTATYRSLVLPSSDAVPAISVPLELLARVPAYADTEPPVVFGHYWMPPTKPIRLAKNAACVDHSVALKTGGFLTAYRWSGESELDDDRFVSVATVHDRCAATAPQSPERLLTFQEAAEEFSRMPTPTLEEMREQSRRNRELLAKRERALRSEEPADRGILPDSPAVDECPKSGGESEK